MSQLFDSRSLHVPHTFTELVLLIVVLGAIFFTVKMASGAGIAAITVIIALGAFVVDAHIMIPLGILVAGIVTAYRPRNTAIKRQPQRYLIELLIVGAGFMLYEIGRVYTQGKLGPAIVNAERIERFQSALGWPAEASFQAHILGNTVLVETFNFIYSFTFLATIVGVLIWLYLNDDSNYRLYRNALAISATATIIISYLFPVAPPRLFPGSNLVDTHVVMGHEHGFANELAAMPSLHIGWTVLAGFVLIRVVGGWRGWTLAAVPFTVLSLTVVVTGNHYWLDGVVGAAICILSVGMLIAIDHRYPTGLPTPRLVTRAGHGMQRAVQPLTHIVSICGAACRSITALAIMLGYLLVGQMVAPDFTDHWGYLTAQVAATLAVVATGEFLFRNDGGLFSWQTHLAIGTATALDLLGTSEDMYANYAAYDKIVHFVGTAAFTAVVLDILGKLVQHHKLSWPRTTLIAVGVAAGITAGMAWEVYEYVGDHVFNSARTGGFWDTTYDLIFDSLGAFVVGLIFVFAHSFNWGVLSNYQWRDMAARIDRTEQGSGDSYITDANTDGMSD